MATKVKRRILKKWEHRADELIASWKQAWVKHRRLPDWFYVEQKPSGLWFAAGGSACGGWREGRTRGEAVIKFHRSASGRHRVRFWNRAYDRDEV
mgnify:CR=1 FL=1